MPLANDSGLLVTCLFILYRCQGAPTSYTGVGCGFPGILSVSFADQIPVPIWNFDHDVFCAVRYALAAQTAIGSQTRRERQFFFFGVAHLRDRLETLANNAMAGGTGAHTTARQGNS